MFRVRLLRDWPFDGCRFDDIELTATLPLEEADALICEFEPTRDLFTHPRPAAWWASEPLSYPLASLRRPAFWMEAQFRLKPWQHMHHAHEDPRYRVPCMTHFKGAVCQEGPGERQRRAVAIFSNRISVAPVRPEVRFRTRMVTHPRVDLYGPRERWEGHRASLFSRPGLPPNYRGPVPGNWSSPDRIATMARYHAAVCLENTQEPYYFTEKLVGAARAGCVPIYRAHPTVRETFLTGARWVDPADFDFDIDRTLKFALAQDREAFAEPNRQWFRSDVIARTSWEAIMERISRTLHAIANGGPP